MAVTALSIDEVNNLFSDHFIKIFGNVVEHCPAAAISILKNRPFKTASDIIVAFWGHLDGLNIHEKENIFNLQVDVTCRLADITNDLDQRWDQSESCMCTTADFNCKINNLNKQYRKKFNLPFVICTWGNTLSTVMNSMEYRINNDKEQEMNMAMEEIKKICAIRVNKIIVE